MSPVRVLEWRYSRYGEGTRFLELPWLSFLPSQVLLSCCIETIIFLSKRLPQFPCRATTGRLATALRQHPESLVLGALDEGRETIACSEDCVLVAYRPIISYPGTLDNVNKA